MTENIMLLLAAVISIAIVAVLRWKTSVAGLSHAILVTLACLASATVVVLMKDHTFNFVHMFVDALLVFGPIHLLAVGIVSIFKRQAI